MPDGVSVPSRRRLDGYPEPGLSSGDLGRHVFAFVNSFGFAFVLNLFSRKVCDISIFTFIREKCAIGMCVGGGVGSGSSCLA